MTEREVLARRLVVGLAGSECTRAEADWLARWRPAGVILFRRNIAGPAQLDRLCRRLREVLPGDAEIVVDHEGGPVAVAEAAVGRPPAPFTLATVDDPDLTRRVHRATARRLARAGIDRVLAPVADVLTEPANPVIGARAFGDSPDRAAWHVAAAVRGLTEGGVGCCLKHWPGHGATGVDPHDVLPASGADRPEARAAFAAGWAAGADAVLVGHLPDRSGTPASLDPARIAAARRRAGRPVTVWCDDVSMGALRPVLGRLLPPDLREGTGLLPPERLPLAWFVAVGKAGADRIPVRSIPWSAFPVPGDRGAPDRRTPPPGEDPAPLPDAAWGEARRRAVAGETWPPPAPEGPLLWWDAWGDHRWPAPPADLPRRAGWRGPFDRWTGAGPPGGDGYAHLLLTAPVVPGPGTDPPPGGSLAGEGRAVAAGHPGLAAWLRDRLPPGWRVTAVYDTAPDDLAPLWEGGEEG